LRSALRNADFSRVHFGNQVGIASIDDLRCLLVGFAAQPYRFTYAVAGIGLSFR